MDTGAGGEVSTREGQDGPRRAGDTGVTVDTLQRGAAQPVPVYLPFPAEIAIYCRNGQYEEKVRFLA